MNPEKLNFNPQPEQKSVETAEHRELSEQPSVSLSRENLDEIFAQEEFNPNQLLELLEKDFPEYSQDSGVCENLTLRQHTLSVIQQYEKFLESQELPNGVSKKLVRFILAMHDIGKPRAFTEGDKSKQYQYTTEILDNTMERLGFNERDLRIAKTLVSGDPLGQYLKDISPVSNAKQIQEMATRSGLSKEDFFKLLKLYYMVDASSYTERVTGIHSADRSLEDIFVWDEQGNALSFSEKVGRKINRLEELILRNNIELPENRLLQPPERIAETAIHYEESELTFAFASERRRCHIGLHDGQPFLEIEYYNELPDFLSEEDKTQFVEETRKIKGQLQRIYVRRYGNAPKIDETEEYDPHDTKEFHVAEPLDFSKDIFLDFLKDEGNKESLETILARNWNADNHTIQDIAGQLTNAIKRGGTVLKEILDLIPKETQAKISEEIKQAAREKLLPHPKQIDVEKLAELISNKRVILYTGAGVSIAGGVYGMEDLQKALQIDLSREVDGFTQLSIQEPQKILEAWEGFTKPAFNAQPTPAHEAIQRLSQEFEAHVLTENIDFIHEQTGIKPIHLTGQWQREGIESEWLKDVDVIIVVGLGYDNKGFLRWYKENNHSGRIVAINVDQPPYLNQDDFIIRGDAQKVVPDLASRFIEVIEEKT